MPVCTAGLFFTLEVDTLVSKDLKLEMSDCIEDAEVSVCTDDSEVTSLFFYQRSLFFLEFAITFKWKECKSYCTSSKGNEQIDPTTARICAHNARKDEQNPKMQVPVELRNPYSSLACESKT